MKKFHGTALFLILAEILLACSRKTATSRLQGEEASEVAWCEDQGFPCLLESRVDETTVNGLFVVQKGNEVHELKDCSVSKAQELLDIRKTPILQPASFVRARSNVAANPWLSCRAAVNGGTFDGRWDRSMKFLAGDSGLALSFQTAAGTPRYYRFHSTRCASLIDVLGLEDLESMEFSGDESSVRDFTCGAETDGGSGSERGQWALYRIGNTCDLRKSFAPLVNCFPVIHGDDFGIRTGATTYVLVNRSGTMTPGGNRAGVFIIGSAEYSSDDPRSITAFSEGIPLEEKESNILQALGLNAVERAYDLADDSALQYFADEISGLLRFAPLVNLSLTDGSLRLERAIGSAGHAWSGAVTLGLSPVDGTSINDLLRQVDIKKESVEKTLRFRDGRRAYLVTTEYQDTAPLLDYSYCEDQDGLCSGGSSRPDVFKSQILIEECSKGPRARFDSVLPGSLPANDLYEERKAVRDFALSLKVNPGSPQNSRVLKLPCLAKSVCKVKVGNMSDWRDLQAGRLKAPGCTAGMEELVVELPPNLDLTASDGQFILKWDAQRPMIRLSEAANDGFPPTWRSLTPAELPRLTSIVLDGDQDGTFITNLCPTCTTVPQSAYGVCKGSQLREPFFIPTLVVDLTGNLQPSLKVTMRNVTFRAHSTLTGDRRMALLVRGGKVVLDRVHVAAPTGESAYRAYNQALCAVDGAEIYAFSSDWQADRTVVNLLSSRLFLSGPPEGSAFQDDFDMLRIGGDPGSTDRPMRIKQMATNSPALSLSFSDLIGSNALIETLKDGIEIGRQSSIKGQNLTLAGPRLKEGLYDKAGSYTEFSRAMYFWESDGMVDLSQLMTDKESYLRSSRIAGFKYAVSLPFGRCALGQQNSVTLVEPKNDLRNLSQTLTNTEVSTQAQNEFMANFSPSKVCEGINKRLGKISCKNTSRCPKEFISL